MRVTEKVKRVLDIEPHTRNSDKDLILKVWEIEGLHLSDRQKEILKSKCTMPDSITRIRRQLREEFPPSEQVDEWRFDKYREYKYGETLRWL